MWVVRAEPGDALLWDYGSGYFPRRCYSKKDALKVAETAKKKGAKNVVVEKVTPTVCPGSPFSFGIGKRS